MKHLHHLEWSSHGNWFEQKHPSLVNKKTITNNDINNQNNMMKCENQYTCNMKCVELSY